MFNFNKKQSNKSQFSSKKYWEDRYSSGDNSGAGSYGRLADYKAEFINSFIEKEGVTRAIELGCGDGNQLGLINYPEYIGLDVSETSIEACGEKYRNDNKKSFFLYNPNLFYDNLGIFKSDTSLSLDVIFHLIEDSVYETYMKNLFEVAEKNVLIYSSNQHNSSNTSKHVKHRKFTEWTDLNLSNWSYEEFSNKYPFDPKNPRNTSFAKFFVFSKSKSSEKF